MHDLTLMLASDAALRVYQYAALFFLAIVEGPLVMMTAGFLLRLGYLKPLPAYAVLLAGDLAADSAWYYVGYFGAHPLVSKYGRFLSLSEARINKILVHFRNHLNKILFLSKITMGFGFALAILITAGIARIPFTKFMAINFFGGLLWTGLLIGCGYFFGNVYYTIGNDLRLIFILAAAIVLLLALYGFSRFMRRKYYNP